MSLIKKGFCLVVLVGLCCLIGAQNADAAAFAGKKLSIDMQAEPDAGNDAKTDDGVVSIAPPAAGDTVRVQVFVADAAGNNTIGYNIVFDNTGDIFTTHFTIESISGLVSQLGVDATTATGGTLPPGSAVAANNYLATVVLTAKIDIPEGAVISFVGGTGQTTVGDAADFGNDALDVDGVTLTFQTPVGPALSGPGAATEIPRGASASATVSLANLTAGDTIDWTVTVSGDPTITVDGQSGLTFQTTAAAATETITLTATGSGDGSAVVAASVNGTAVDPSVTVVFSEQVPAELASFGGEIVESGIALNWTTTSQTNNAGWKVMRSLDGVTYEPVSDLLPGAGTSDAVLNYTHTDESIPAVEKIFYRLDQIDLDGAIHSTTPIELILGARFLDLPSEFATSVYPNPFNPSTTIAYDLPSEAAVSIVIYDALGQEIRRLVTDQKAAGRYTIQWDARDNLGRSVASGVYIAKVEADQFSVSQKMLLLK